MSWNEHSTSVSPVAYFCVICHFSLQKEPRDPLQRREMGNSARHRGERPAPEFRPAALLSELHHLTRCTTRPGTVLRLGGPTLPPGLCSWTSPPPPKPLVGHPQAGPPLLPRLCPEDLAQHWTRPGSFSGASWFRSVPPGGWGLCGGGREDTQPSDA